MEEFSNGQCPIEKINEGQFSNAKFNEKYRIKKSRTLEHGDHIGMGGDMFCKEEIMKQTLNALQHFGVGMGNRAYAELLHAFAKAKALAEGKMVHSHMIKTGSYPDTFVSNHLINIMCELGGCGTGEGNPCPHGYVHNKQGEKAMKQLHRMQREGIQPDRFSLSII
ncbi:hypothetical protein SUGI_1134630 [Cryptomeria japonica]|nr:hypothetical protein SUGI_1134630 [Cryptomeria japonica]